MRRHIEESDRDRRGGGIVRGATVVTLGVLLVTSGNLHAASLMVQKQISPMRQDSIKMSSVPDVPRTTTPTIEPSSTGTVAQFPSQLPASEVGEIGIGFGYDPSGRRDPFAPVVQELQPGKTDANLPPLQRVTLTELNLIAIVWGAYGYTAMVQTPEGHGYTVRRGTRIGQNNGVVSAITERGIIVQERFTDVYGKKQEREYVKLLHPKEGSE